MFKCYSDNCFHHSYSFFPDALEQIVDKNTEWDGGLVLVNSYGFGGVNTTIVLQPCGRPAGLEQKEQAIKEMATLPKSFIPQMITVSGRTEDGVRFTLEQVRRFQLEIKNDL
jgi:acyl transferase domain-containing protein